MEVHARLKPTFIYGYTSSISGGAHFVDNGTIVFPIGRVLAFHDIERNVQSYVKVNSTFKINAVAISPNRKVVAVGIVGHKPAISFYDTATSKRLMTVGNPAEGFKAKMFEHLEFTQDSVYLVAVTNEPEGLLIYYKWETGGVVAHTKADGKIVGTSSIITTIAPHPLDSSVLVIGGIGIFRLMKLYYNEWRQYGFKRAEYWPISGVCWITPELVLVGTRDGRLMVIEESLVKGEFRVHNLLEIRVSEKDDSRKHNTKESDQRFDHDSGLEVRGLTAFSQGFAFAFVSGEVCVFKKTGKRLWVKKNVIATGAPSLWEELTPKVNFVRCIDISPSEETLLCTSGASEVYYATIFQEQDVKSKEKPHFKLIHDGFHYGPVSTISTCLYKPHFLSVGETDRTCRIWNFETLKMINSITFTEDILTAAFHPSGDYCIIAFDETVKVFMILLEGMKTIATLNYKSSNIVRYSRRGNIFACMDTSVVLIHAGTTFEKLWEFNPSNDLASMHFSANDFVLFTGGLDGIINKYCLKTGKELFKIEIQSSVVHDMASSLDGMTLYVVGTDGYLKVVLTGGEKTGLMYNHFLNQSVLNSVVTACDDTVLLVAGQSQVVSSIRMPIDHPQGPVLKTFKLHSAPILKMEMTHVNPTLVCQGRDGVISIWQVMGLGCMKQKQSFLRYYREVDEVIVNAENWSNKRSIMKEQQEIMNRLDWEYDQKVKAIEADKEAQETKLSGRYQGILDIIGLNNKITQSKNATEIDKMAVNNAMLREKFDSELVTQRVHFEERLRSEQRDLKMWHTGWGNVKHDFDQLINSVRMGGLCIAKRLEYFSTLELTRRVNETHMLKDDVNTLIEEQKARELTLLKHSQFEIDEFIENSERHEQYAVEIIQLRSQKQKLCEQVEGLESTYYNMQEFLREAHKTITNLDHRKSQKKQLEFKQKKIQEKRDAIRESGKDILDNIEVSKSYSIQHMVSEECIEGLCQINHLLIERKSLKEKEHWLREELVDSNRALNRLCYVLSFLSLQNYLHNNALKKNMSRKKDKTRKMHFFTTNLKKEIHSMMCGADYGNLKGRLINLCSQYADPKVDHLELLDKMSGNKELWKAITHLEATKLHFGNCVSRMRITTKRKSCEKMLDNYAKVFDDDVDADVVTDNIPEGSPVNSEVSIEVKTKEETLETHSTGLYKKKELEFETSVEDSSSWDEYQTSDDESNSSCKRSTGADIGNEQPCKEVVGRGRKRSQKEPLSVHINRCKTKKARTTFYGNLLEEKKLIVARLADVKKRIVHRKNMEKLVKTGIAGDGKAERATYNTLYSRIPMDSIIKALNKEVQHLSRKSPVHDLINQVFPNRVVESKEDVPHNTGHLCSLCKGYDMFTKYFESADGKPAAMSAKKKSKTQQRSQLKGISELITPVTQSRKEDVR